MIKSFKNVSTEDFYHGISSKESRKIPPTLNAAGHRKLDMVNAAHTLTDLLIPPANRLEALKGDRKGYHSIRINDQYRVVFRWADGNAHEVVIEDYH